MNVIRYDRFDWDDGNWPKCGKHGVSQKEVESLFMSNHTFKLSDPAHSDREARHRAIGCTPLGRYILVAYTLRRRHHETLIRPISARYMHQKEIDYYEQAQKALTASDNG